MSKYIPNEMVKEYHGKLCMHSDVYFAKRNDTLYTGKICNPYNGEPTAAQTAQRAKFTTARANAATALADPEKAILRGADFYRAKGYPDKWINQRLQSIEMRKELTDEWKERGIELEQEYAILTNEMTRAWSGMTVRQYKNLKGLTKESLRDNMTNLELVLNMLEEVTTTTISRSRKPETFDESRQIAREGGTVARDTRRNIESRIGQSVISATNAQDKTALEVHIPEVLPMDTTEAQSDKYDGAE